MQREQRRGRQRPTWCYRNAAEGDTSVGAGPLGASLPGTTALPSERDVAPHGDGDAGAHGKPHRARKAAHATAGHAPKRARRGGGAGLRAAAARRGGGDDSDEDESDVEAEVVRPSPQPVRHQRRTRAAVAAGVVADVAPLSSPMSDDDDDDSEEA